jgi:hypothetical protein
MQPTTHSVLPYGRPDYFMMRSIGGRARSGARPERFEGALRSALNTPYKPLKEKPKIKVAKKTVR